MRITIKLDGFDHAAALAYAVLWLDKERGRWSREAHDGFELPPWGTWRSAPDGTLLLDPDTLQAVLMLHGLRLNAPAGIAGATGTDDPSACAPSESQKGRANYFGCGADGESRAPDAGHWHVQCIDRESTVAEHEVFSDEPDAVSGQSAHAHDAGSLAM
ncbi:DUF3564 family protein [Caballeronia ptereochthonis]|uniref:Uncharacterized protein n=1 Tax=Caballeronia ptereochthonis TaxID=1777144 RepID=A0A158DH03_9BURK|nr:DUF3564 family protein [Caballeronia ptereochthonis]SAK93911.1 hypothetical protein AWB83_05455 [Caballeronia ptereochthonis]